MSGYTRRRHTDHEKDMWAAHDAFHTSMESGAKNAFEYNITVPSEHIAEMVEYAKQLGKAKGLKVMAYAHAGSGGMHIHAVSDGDKTEFKTAVAETEGELYAKCVSLGGGVRGEYGFGYAKKAYTPADVRAAFAASKNALDPKKYSITERWLRYAEDIMLRKAGAGC